MVFKLFERDTAPAPTSPSMTIQKGGLISLNAAAADLLSNPAAVQLYYDGDFNIIGIKAVKPGAAHSFKTRRQPTSKKSSSRHRGTMLFSGQLFTKRIGLDTSQARRYTPRMDPSGDMLTVDLKQGGHPVSSNRHRAAQTELRV
jgi:hypothetical protein